METYIAPKLYEVKEGKVIRVGNSNRIATFDAGRRLWLTEQEAELHRDAIVLIYPPKTTPTSENA